MTATQQLRALIVEDNADDAELVARELRKSGFDLITERVEDAAGLHAQLCASDWDIVISDHVLPQFDSFMALKIVREESQDTPFIVVSGRVGEGLAVEVMKAGATDFILKDKLTRLAPAIRRELEEAKSRRKRRGAEEALRESRDQLRLVSDNLPALIAYVDAEANYRFANRTCANWYARPIDEIPGLSVMQVQDDAYTKFRPHITAVLGGETQKFEECVAYPDGRTRDVRLTYVPDLGTADEVKGFFEFAEDITEIKQAEQQLRQAQKMEAVGQLTGGVAHDFNNLLAIILGNAELLEERNGENNLLSRVIRAAERGAELTQNLLAFSRRQPLWPKVFDFNDVIDRMGDIFRQTLDESIEIKTMAAAELWAVEADEGQVENLLLNLTINARDAMSNHGILRIETANVTLGDKAAAAIDIPAGDYATLSVTDDGCGIPAELLDRVIEPFFTTKEVGEGSGLGLSMAYGFAKQSGGKLAIESEVGQGTSVKLFLPRTDKALTRSPPAAPERDITAYDATVLVVEDEPDVRWIATTLLSEQGYKVLDTSDGEAAIAELTSADRIDLLLTDVVLPGSMNGSELATKARNCQPGIKILFMSGYPDTRALQEIQLDQSIGLLKKPFNKSELARMVRDALNGERMNP